MKVSGSSGRFFSDIAKPGDVAGLIPCLHRQVPHPCGGVKTPLCLCLPCGGRGTDVDEGLAVNYPGYSSPKADSNSAFNPGSFRTKQYPVSRAHALSVRRGSYPALSLPSLRGKGNWRGLRVPKSQCHPHPGYADPLPREGLIRFLPPNRAIHPPPG